MSAFRLLLRLLLMAMVAVSLYGQPVRPNIFIDNDTGLAEGAASGAPEGMTPIIPPNQCATTGASNTIQSPGHGLGATPVDGSAAVWINTASGPRWFVLTGIPNGDTFTVQSWQTPNIAAAVDCVVGGRLAGPPGSLNITSARGLSRDFSQGWTITIVNTGTPYVETNTVGFPLNQNAVAGGVASQGRQVIRGDDPDNPTEIEIQHNNDYIVDTTGGITVKVENLEFVRNASGTASTPIEADSATSSQTVRNVIVRQVTGTWSTPFQIGNVENIVMSSEFHGPFTNGCIGAGDDGIFVNNYFDGCSGTVSALFSVFDIVLFNIWDNQGASDDWLNGNINNGAGGHFLYNTLISTGDSGVIPGFNENSTYSGNYLEEASTLAGACFNAGATAVALLGAATFGPPSNIWQGNAANQCTTARYAGGLDASSQGSATDINAGLAFDILFTDPGTLNYFPGNAEAKSSLVFPGASYPLLTPAEPVSTMTVGAAQRPGGGGGSAYAY